MTMRLIVVSIFVLGLAALQLVKARHGSVGPHLLSQDKTRTFSPTATFVPDRYSVHLNTNDLEKYGSN